MAALDGTGADSAADFVANLDFVGCAARSLLILVIVVCITLLGARLVEPQVCSAKSPLLDEVAKWPMVDIFGATAKRLKETNPRTVVVRE